MATPTYLRWCQHPRVRHGHGEHSDWTRYIDSQASSLPRVDQDAPMHQALVLGAVFYVLLHQVGTNGLAQRTGTHVIAVLAYFIRPVLPPSVVSVHQKRLVSALS